jgi:Dolichyl-phosphate-mannose-protein mannosyltransferase
MKDSIYGPRDENQRLDRYQQGGVLKTDSQNGDAGKPNSYPDSRASMTSAQNTSVSWRAWLRWSLAPRAMAAVIGGLILRLWMMRAFPQDGGDALIYGDLGKNLLQHGVFAITDGSGVVHSTLIRLPGYPLFLAFCFRVFGVANYHAVEYLQIALELAACLLLADFVRRIRSPRAGLNTLWLAAMCPFTAVYASAPLTESLTLDMICLALWALERYSSSWNVEVKRWRWLAAFTFAISLAAMLRPDGALLAFALWPALVLSRPAGIGLGRALRPALLCGVISILPFVAWSVRNEKTFHVFEPLAPRYAGDPGEDPHLGWQHWVKTWCLDFTCTSEIYWNVPDGSIALDDLPGRAFDSPAQQEETAAIFDEYNRDEEISPALDARFDALARERSKAHPLRTWVLLPLGRLGDMTLRPRVENLTIELRWWEYRHHWDESLFSLVYAAVNLFLLHLGLNGLRLKPRWWPYMAGYMALRCLLLMTIEAPETRYTLEFFPIIFAAGGIALERKLAKRRV